MVNSFELERSQGSLLLFAVTQRSKHQALQRCRGKWTGIRSHFHNFELIVKTLWANYTTTGPRADSGHSIVFSSLRKTFTPHVCAGHWYRNRCGMKNGVGKMSVLKFSKKISDGRRRCDAAGLVVEL